MTLRSKAACVALCLLTLMHGSAPSRAQQSGDRVPPGARAQPAQAALTIFAASSLMNALQDLGDAFTRQSSVPVKFSFAASSTLARQIEQGAPADLFMSADADWMDYLQARHLIQNATRRDVVGNRLVLIAPADSTLELTIAPNFPLAAALGSGGRLATGDPASVPAGRYAEAALKSLKVWDAVSGRLARAESVRSALVFVDRGEAPLGIVYQTDALIDRGVRVVDVFPADSHAPIVYPVALTRIAEPGAAGFLAFVTSVAAAATFKSYGFMPLQKTGAGPPPASPVK